MRLNQMLFKPSSVVVFSFTASSLHQRVLLAVSIQLCTEAALFFDFAKRIMFILNDLTTPELRLAKAENLLSGAETVSWVDCSADFVGQTVYDFFQRSRNEGASFNFPFPNKVDELWKKEVAKRGLTCVDNEFTLERKQAIFCEVLKCIIKKLKKKIATLAKAVQAANASENHRYVLEN